MFDLYGCCRLCLKKKEHALINCPDIEELSAAITSVFGFEILSTDSCSTKICRECSYKVTDFSIYRDSVLSNQKSIQQCQVIQSKLREIPIKEEDDSDDDVILVSYKEQSDVQKQILYKYENTKPTKRCAKKSTTTLVSQIPKPCLNNFKKLKVCLRAVTEDEVSHVFLRRRDRKHLHLRGKRREKICHKRNGQNNAENALTTDCTIDSSKNYRNICSNDKPAVCPPIRLKIDKLTEKFSIQQVNTAKPVLNKNNSTICNSNQDQTSTKCTSLAADLLSSITSPMISIPISSGQCSNNNSHPNMKNVVWSSQRPCTTLLTLNKQNIGKHKTNNQLGNNAMPNFQYKQLPTSTSHGQLVTGSSSPLQQLIQMSKPEVRKTLISTTEQVSENRVSCNMSLQSLPSATKCHSTTMTDNIVVVEEYIPLERLFKQTAPNINVNDNKVKVLSVNELNMRAEIACTDIRKLPIRITMVKIRNELQIKLTDSKNVEVSFYNLSQQELLAVRNSLLQPSSRSQIQIALKSCVPDQYSQNLLNYIGLTSLIP